MFDFLNVLGALGVLITFLMNIKSDKKGRQFSKEAIPAEKLTNYRTHVQNNWYTQNLQRLKYM